MTKHSTPLVSIGLPVHNGERFIRRALDSLIAQDYPNVEIIVSDNASEDATLAICNDYADRHPTIRAYANSINEGIVANSRRVFELSRGKYFMWAGVDDFWYPRYVSTLVSHLERNPNAAVAFCNVDRIYDDGTPAGTVTFDHLKTWFGSRKTVINVRLL